MNIIEKIYKWNGNLVKRKKTDYIIIHHCAGTGDADYIHNLHIGNGWTGFGYHFYVRTNGEVYRGRPIDCAGAHTVNYNSVSVGICFEGNYETTKTMPASQLKSGKELVAYLKKMYPDAKVGKHRDYASTACPGKYFPFKEITEGDAEIKKAPELESVNDIVWELSHRGIITDKELWLKKLSEDENAYWLARKTANMTVNK